MFSHLVNDAGKAVTLRRGYPVETHSGFFNAELGQHFLEQGYAAGGLYITFQVMAFAGMSAADEYAVSPFFKGFKNEGGVDPPGAHDTHYSDIGFVFLPGRTGEVGASIGAPVA